MTCDVCGLPDPYRGQGDGIGSCDCPRCPCWAARWSVFCVCDTDDEYDPADWDDDGPWPDDERHGSASAPDEPDVRTIQPSEAYL